MVYRGFQAKANKLCDSCVPAIPASTSFEVQQLSEKPVSRAVQAAAGAKSAPKSAVALAGAPAQLYIHGEPSAEEQYMLELVNRARRDPAAEAARYGIDLNEGITADPISTAPKQPLGFNPQLIQAARGHSDWMLDNDTFAHVETGGIDPADRMEAAGYLFSGAYSYGENIAFRGTTGSALPVAPTVGLEHADLFVDKGIEHQGHRVNLMTSSFREVGIGVGLGAFTSNGRDYNAVMVPQDFGAERHLERAGLSEMSAVR